MDPPRNPIYGAPDGGVRGVTREAFGRIADAPFAFVDLDAMWANAGEMLARGARWQADPRGEQVGAPARELLRRVLGRDERFSRAH